MIAAIYFRIVVAAGCLLLALAASASAECAWALWKQPYTSMGGEGKWETWAAYPTVAECTQMLDRREAEARKGVPFIEISKRAPTELFLKFREDQSDTFTSGISWQCFPDTVDPRGPKGTK